MLSIAIDPHPLLDVVTFETQFPAPLGSLGARPAVVAALSLEAPAPLASSDEVRGHVRDLLRHGGYKPTGRGKPASEYLLRAVTESALGSINLAVDACNVVSLHSGLPISVVDLDRVAPPLRVGVAPAGSSYVFNATGQTIDTSGLLCLFDAEGPTANAVKDSQRTKTHDGTTRTLSVIWSSKALPGRAEAAFGWYRDLLVAEGATVTRA
jgi:DNA/RNA-binding domain of Phe-tRNA-synthetase-like protein